MGKECGAWVSRRLWGGSNTSPLETTAWEASRECEARGKCIPRVIRDGRGGKERTDIYLVGSIVSVNCIRWAGHPPVLGKRKCFW